MALQLIKISEFPQVSEPGDWIVVSDAAGTGYKISKEDFKEWLGTVTVIADKPIALADPAPTLDGVYLPTESGTYTNAGGLEYDPEGVDAGKYVQFIKNDAVWTKLALDLPMQDISGLVPKTDIVNNLVTEEAERPLSAEQGVVIKSLFDAISDNIIIQGTPVDISGIVWTPNTFVNSAGNISSTVGSLSTSNYIALPFADIDYRYIGNFSGSGIHLGFYRDDNTFVSAIPNSSAITDKTNFVFHAPPEAAYIRVTCVTDDTVNFGLFIAESQIELKGNTEQMLLNEQYGIDSATYNEDGVLSLADVTWNDGISGVATMGDYNSEFMSYDSYQVTYEGSPSKTLAQPVVTRDVDGNIIVKPNLTII